MNMNTYLRIERLYISNVQRKLYTNTRFLLKCYVGTCTVPPEDVPILGRYLDVALYLYAYVSASFKT